LSEIESYCNMFGVSDLSMFIELVGHIDRVMVQIHRDEKKYKLEWEERKEKLICGKVKNGNT